MDFSNFPYVLVVFGIKNKFIFYRENSIKSKTLGQLGTSLVLFSDDRWHNGVHVIIQAP